MSIDCNKILNVLKREGTDQQMRVRGKLMSDQLNLIDFDLSDWVLFAFKFADYVKFPEKDPSGIGRNNWRDFFNLFPEEGYKETDLEDIKDSIAAFLRNAEQEHNLTPHLTLYVVFLKLIQKSQKRFNGLTKRHLDFYYQNILHIEKKPLRSDHVYVLFELAKNFSEGRVPQGTSLDAGKDLDGKKLIYKTTEEVVVNTAKISHLKSIYHQEATNNQPGYLGAAPVVNSKDGLGEEFLDGSKSWRPFRKQASLSAKLGFSLSSHMLRLAEGERKIEVSFSFDKDVEIDGAIGELFSVTLTGEDGWYKPTGGIVSSIAERTLTLTIRLNEDEPAIVPFNNDLHEGSYRVHEPVIRVNVDVSGDTGYAFYSKMSKAIFSSFEIEVKVDDVRNVQLENSFGPLDPQRPFFPFTPRPVKGGYFQVSYAEALQKNPESITVEMDWVNLPDDFKKLYEAYDAGVEGSSYFTFTEAGASNDKHLLFQGSHFNYEFTTGLDKDLKVKLTETFLHEIYPRIYTQKAINLGCGDKLPNEPYTPLAENISLSYKATLTVDLNEGNDGKALFFHELPFGYVQKFPRTSQEESSFNLLPDYDYGGELYIGLENASPRQQISLLFQLTEGSENPLSVDRSAGERVEWAFLSKNVWRELPPESILKDQTNNFLQSGIFRCVLPVGADVANTVLPTGYHWLRARKKKISYDAVCEFVDVKAQVVEAKFEDNGNNTGHLEHGLSEETISNLTRRVSAFKGIAQPFPSFGGRLPEADLSFYRRVSERLRHKNRTVSLWDYEHMVLENFPRIYKVKCLNHTSGDNYQSPGYIEIVVIPDTVNQKVYDMFQPRVSQAVRDQIQDFVSARSSFHVRVKVLNPLYREVKVKLKVKFKAGYEENYYRQEIRQEINRFLAPWAYEKETLPEFGNSLHKSLLIHFLEGLEYVDYLRDVEIQVKGSGGEFDKVSSGFVQDSNPKAILVPADRHSVDLVE
ncbi:baseplate J/gp47 family protein [Cytophagaceae bacterium ABcell3]|nr:baseplate J/gp47 family protein [Cytophagaceae bacterium ABcell3]